MDAAQTREEARAIAAADPTSAEPGAVAALTSEIKTLEAKADEADQVLFKAVRAELHGRFRPSACARLRTMAGRLQGRQTNG